MGRGYNNFKGKYHCYPTASSLDWPALDVLRAVGVISMVVFHSIHWLRIRDDSGALDSFADSIIIRYSIWMGLPALWLPIIAGSSIVLRQARGTHQGGVRLPRGLENSALGILFFAIGISLNFLLWNTQSLWRWDILHYTGACFFVYGILEAVGLTRLIGLIGLVALVLGRAELPVISFLKIDQQSVWPLLPWFCIFAFGAVLAQWRRHRQESFNCRTEWELMNRVLPPLIALGLVSIAFSTQQGRAFIIDAHPFYTSIYLPPTEVLGAIMGVYFITIFCLERLSFSFPLRNWIREPFARISAGALWILVVHILIGFPLSDLFWRVLSPKRALICFPIYIVLLSWATAQIAWSQRGKKITIRLSRSLGTAKVLNGN